jgi:uncharacterized membrane protein
VTLTLLGLQVLSTVFMTGLIWFVQIVHYPLMDNVAGEAFTRYERRHQRATTWVVAPAMLVELVTAIGLVVVLSQPYARALAIAGLALVLAIWGSTLGLQMPLHRRLAEGHQPALIHRLVQTNWIRTVLWSLRSALVLLLAYEVMG